MSPYKARPDPQKSLVGFVVGEVAYAVAIGVVKEIVNPSQLTELPHAPLAVAGVMDHRGEVVPVVDLRLRFGLPAAADARRCKWILIDVDGRSVGLAVDRVTGVFGAAGSDIKPPPSLGEGDHERGVIGVTSHEGALTFVLDVRRIDALTLPVRGQSILLAGVPEGP